MLKVEDLFERRIIEKLGKNPRTKETIVVKRNIWIADGLEIACSEGFINALVNCKLTDEEIKDIREMFEVMVKDEGWLDNATEEDITEVNKAIELCKVGMSDLGRCIVLNVLDNNCLCAFEDYDEVKEVERFLGKLMAEIWGRIYLFDEDEDDE